LPSSYRNWNPIARLVRLILYNFNFLTLGTMEKRNTGINCCTMWT
jgi:hypothetical protein